MAVKKDEFANVIAYDLTLSAANTLTFSEIIIGLNIYDKVALVIHRFEFEPKEAALNEMTAAGDSIAGALVSSNQISGLTPDNIEVIDRRKIFRLDMGTAGSGQILEQPITSDFSEMPGGGLLVPPKPLYWAGDSTGLASAAGMILRLYFTIKQLSDAQYLELLETRRAFG